MRPRTWRKPQLPSLKRRLRPVQTLRRQTAPLRRPRRAAPRPIRPPTQPIVRRRVRRLPLSRPGKAPLARTLPPRRNLARRRAALLTRRTVRRRARLARAAQRRPVRMLLRPRRAGPRKRLRQQLRPTTRPPRSRKRLLLPVRLRQVSLLRHQQRAARQLPLLASRQQRPLPQVRLRLPQRPALLSKRRPQIVMAWCG